MVGINYFSKQNLLYSQAKAVAIEKIKKFRKILSMSMKLIIEVV